MWAENVNDTHYTLITSRLNLQQKSINTNTKWLIDSSHNVIAIHNKLLKAVFASDSAEPRVIWIQLWK